MNKWCMLLMCVSCAQLGYVKIESRGAEEQQACLFDNDANRAICSDMTIYLEEYEKAMDNAKAISHSNHDRCYQTFEGNTICYRHVKRTK